jgi:RimJ/RimL family protein N-acetyltransferase
MKNIYKISNTSVYLKELKTKDVTLKYIKWMNDYEVTKYTEQKYFKHSKRKIIKFVNNKLKSKSEYLYGIFLKNKNMKIHVGNIKIGPIDFFHKNALISYFVGEKNFWGMGICSIAIKKIIFIAKNKFKLKKIYAGFYENNIASKKVLMNNGFKLEAKFKSHLIFEKKRISHIYYGKII